MGLRLNNGDSPINQIFDFYSTGVKKKDLKITFKASDQYPTLSFMAYMFDGNPKSWLSISLNRPTLFDITDQVLAIEKDADALFTDSSQTALKLHVTQKEINELRIRLTDYKSLISGTLYNAVDKKLKKAQSLLDLVVLTLTADDIVNKPSDIHSTTIIGSAYPNSFLEFSNHSDIPAGTLSSGVASDTRKYHIRADNNGKFSYKLPDGKAFQFGENVTITSFLHGKVLTQSKDVLDLVPPDQPILDRLTDKITAFTGKGEKSSSIKVYDANDNRLLVTGTTNLEGFFSIAVPGAMQPLNPYERYYVTATDMSGNTSEKSVIQEVADTTPPTADPVKQILNLGDPLPILSKLYTNLADNAGITGVKTALVNQPDLTKVGYTTAEISLTDKAGNKRTLIVPIIVKDEHVIMDNEHMLYATDFSVLAIDFPLNPEEQKAYLLEKSRAGLWNIETGENKPKELIIDDHQVIRQPGTYEVTFHFGTMTKKIRVTFLSGSLAFEKTADTISYGTPIIMSKRQEIAPEKSIDFLINDSRFQTKNWRLVAKLSSPLQLANGEKTESNLFLSKTTSEGKPVKTPISDQMTTELYDNKEASNGKFPVKFGKSEPQAILLEVVPGSVRSGQEYHTEVIWTLEDGP